MSLEIYKKGQGKTARLTAYVLLGLLVLFGAYRLHATFNRPGEGVLVEGLPLLGALTLMKVFAALAFLGGMLALHVVLNRAAVTDLLIDTEQEMRKVSWPSWAEVKSATLVVVLVTFVMGMMLFGFDWLLQRLFRLIF
jgi:preprotein translocase SecE subunit